MLTPEECAAVVARLKMNWPMIGEVALAGWGQFFTGYRFEELNAAFEALLADEYHRKHEPNEYDFKRAVRELRAKRSAPANRGTTYAVECILCGDYGLLSVPVRRDAEGVFQIEYESTEDQRLYAISIPCTCEAGRKWGMASRLSQAAAEWYASQEVQNAALESYVTCKDFPPIALAMRRYVDRIVDGLYAQHGQEAPQDAPEGTPTSRGEGNRVKTLGEALAAIKRPSRLADMQVVIPPGSPDVPEDKIPF